MNMFSYLFQISEASASEFTENLKKIRNSVGSIEYDMLVSLVIGIVFIIEDNRNMQHLYSTLSLNQLKSQV